VLASSMNARVFFHHIRLQIAVSMAGLQIALFIYFGKQNACSL